MLAVPRHVFVPPELQDSAYLDMPLPIGFGQTISQPLMVAHLLLAAKVQSTDRVLDVGCGSGYQAALLSLLAQQVIGLEIIPQLVQLAADNLQRAGCDGVRVVQGNGRHGYPECAPYDVIIVAAASQDVPPPLLAQLTVGGRLLIPIGADPQQVLQRWTRTETGYETSYLDACRFVPLVP
jgi:protein-L-isoaspartate(D-aspartate) O-methyltransferase